MMRGITLVKSITTPAYGPLRSDSLQKDHEASQHCRQSPSTGTVACPAACQRLVYKGGFSFHKQGCER